MGAPDVIAGAVAPVQFFFTSLLFTVVGEGVVVDCISYFTYRIEYMNRTATYAGDRSMWRMIDIDTEQNAFLTSCLLFVVSKWRLRS